MSPRKKPFSQAEQSARFREAAKKAEVGDGKAFERAFKKVVLKSAQRKKFARRRA